MQYTQGQHALMRLQDRASRARDVYALDVLERAMNEIVGSLDGSQPAGWQVRSAMANSGKVVKRRRQLAPMLSLDAAAEKGPADLLPAARCQAFGELECRDWLCSVPGLTDTDRRLLIAVYDGADAAIIADARDLRVERVREQISRARKRARALHEQPLAA